MHDLIAKLSLHAHPKVTSGTVSLKPADICMTQLTPFLEKRRGTKGVLLKKDTTVLNLSGLLICCNLLICVMNAFLAL